jgi:hypothetical protein
MLFRRKELPPKTRVDLRDLASALEGRAQSLRKRDACTRPIM